MTPPLSFTGAFRHPPVGWVDHLQIAWSHLKRRLVWLAIAGLVMVDWFWVLFSARTPEIRRFRGRVRSLEFDGCPDATQARALKAAVQSEASSG